MTHASVLVIGGGLSGLSAAAQLAESGFAVTVVEKAPCLGGRLASLTDPRTGWPVDRWPAFTLDIGPELSSMLRRVGASSGIVRERSPALPLVGSVPGVLKGSALPGFLGLLPALARDRTLGWLDRLQALRGLLAMGRPAPPRAEQLSLYRHLRNHGQGSRIIGRLWNPLCLLAAGSPVEDTAASVGLPTLGAAIRRGRGCPTLTLFKSGLSHWIGSRFREFVEARGGRVLTSCPAQRVIVAEGSVRGVEVGGELLRADGYVSALPPADLLAALPERLTGHPDFEPAAQVRFRPLISVHLFLDRPVIDSPFAVTGEGEGLIFTHESPVSRSGAAARTHLAVYAPSEKKYLGMGRDEIVERVLKVVSGAMPRVLEAVVDHALVVRHENALLDVSPGACAGRLKTRTLLNNLWLAGTWTDTGRTGCLEAAVVSGRSAALAVRLARAATPPAAPRDAGAPIPLARPALTTGG